MELIKQISDQKKKLRTVVQIVKRVLMNNVFYNSFCMDDVSSTLLFFEKKKLEVFTWTSSLRRAWVFFQA
jgi:hypothetical protein